VTPDSCNWVASCDDCSEHHACAAPGGLTFDEIYYCIEIPEACDGTPTCDCMGDLACPGAANYCRGMSADGYFICDCVVC
jgi:hypothetical protein